MYATYFQQELGDIAKEWVGDVPSPVCIRRLRIFPKVMLQHFRGEDVKMAFPSAAEAQLSTHHGVGERVDVKLACHLHGVGLSRCFGDLDESREAALS